MQWEVSVYRVIRQDGTWLGKDKLDAALAEGWEPFHVQDDRDHIYGMLYHLRRIKHVFTPPNPGEYELPQPIVSDALDKDSDTHAR